MAHVVAALPAVLLPPRFAGACRLADKPVVGILTNNEEVQRLTINAMPILLPTFVCKFLGDGDAECCWCAVCGGVVGQGCCGATSHWHTRHQLTVEAIV
jgi:hypothetical protein